MAYPLYRGDSLRNLNESEFKDNAVTGERIDVYYLRGDPYGIEFPTKYAIRELPNTTVKGRESVWVTGGLTDRIGSAIHFSTSILGVLGLVLFLDPNHVRGNLIRIRYEEPFFHEHPAVAAWVFDDADAVVVMNGKLVGIAETWEEGEEHITEWVTRDLSFWLTESQRFTTEGEVVAYTPEICLDGALLRASGYYGTGAHPQSVNGVLREILEYGERRQVRRWGLKEKVRHLYTETAKRMRMYKDLLTITILNSLNPPALEKADELVKEENFKCLFDGRRWVFDYQKAGMYVGGPF